MVHAGIDDISEKLYSRLKKKTMAKKKKKAMKKTKKKAKKKKKKQKYSSGFLKAIKELELAGVIKETKKNTFKLVKNKHEKEETFN